MKSVSLACFVLVVGGVAAQPELYIGAGHADTSRLSLLAKDIKLQPQPAVYALPRRTDITLPRGDLPVDRTDLIATVSDQQRVLRSLHIDPAPQPPAATQTQTKSTPRPLGNAAHAP